ncbi:MAG: hypothetical protein KAG66_24570, partial [Methylococcales bacterium]|nr:hypothetical protein [Methylococcales bacterium]
IPDTLVRNLQVDDRITLNTDTGATLHFIVTARQQVPSYSASQQLSQNRIGMTLFALTATNANDVSIALAHYDVASERQPTSTLFTVGDRFDLDGHTFQVEQVDFSFDALGETEVTLRGKWEGTSPILLSLNSPTTQATAIQIVPDANHVWQASLILPQTNLDDTLWAEFRTATNELAVVGLGHVPTPLADLIITPRQAVWVGGQMVVTVQVENAGNNPRILRTEDISLEGGDAYTLNPPPPFYLVAGEVKAFTLSLTPATNPVVLQIGTDRWQISTP